MFSERIANYVMQYVGLAGFLALSLALVIIFPLGIVAATAALASRTPRPIWYGLAMGFLVATWCSLCWLTIPYCGAYMNVPGIVTQSVLEVDSQVIEQELCVHITNFIFWPLLGCLVFIGLKVADDHNLW